MGKPGESVQKVEKIEWKIIRQRNLRGLRLGVGAEPMFLSFMPHKLSFKASLQGLLIWKRQTHPLRSGELAVSIDNAAIRSLFTVHSILNQRRAVFTRYLFGWPHSILAYTSRSAPRVGGSWKSLMGLLSSSTCNETLCCCESLCQSAHPVEAMYLSDSHCESGSMSCGLNGTQSTVYLPISCDKVPDIDTD